MKLVKLGAASLNQTPLDWESNQRNILRAIEEARTSGVSILVLPELAISGYGCEDALISPHLARTALQVLTEIAPFSKSMFVSVGLPVFYQGGLYDAVCVLVDGKILGFVAKHYLASEGIHYEPRWFRPWPWGEQGEISISGQQYPIGDLLFDCGELKIGFEICEDAWAAKRPGAQFAEFGVDIILCPSASHFAFGKYEVRKRFVLEGSRAFAVAYAYANMLGNEAGRAIYDGGGLIACGGELLASGKRFSFSDVELLTAVVDLDKNRLNPNGSREILSKGEGSGGQGVYRVLKSEMHFPVIEPQPEAISKAAWENSSSIKEEEFSRAVSLGLFDYLRKSRSNGFVVSLSGGADSTATACLVALLVRFGVAELGLAGFLDKLSYVKELEECGSEQEIIAKLLTCVYQGTRNSSSRTRLAAQEIAQALSASYLEFTVDNLVDTYTDVVAGELGHKLTWEEHDLSLQNIQARVRGPLVWLIANVKRALLLATSNRSEAAVGYCTMDGDTCGGLSPIAGIDKAFLINWLKWLEQGGLSGSEAMPALLAVTTQQPTAELRPQTAGQTDEQDLMPYVVLDAIERHAIRDKKSPLEVYQLILPHFAEFTKGQLLCWVERFFVLWSRNQWKRERFAPSFHLDDENLDPKTWCRFPILSGGFERELAELRSYHRDQ